MELQTPLGRRFMRLGPSMTIRCMHGRCRQATAVQQPQLVTADVGRVEQSDARVPTLRLFRSHEVVRMAEVEFCILCFCRAPRFHTERWRTGCCNGSVLRRLGPGGCLPKVPTRGHLEFPTKEWPEVRRSRTHGGGEGLAGMAAAKVL